MGANSSDSTMILMSIAGAIGVFASLLLLWKSYQYTMDSVRFNRFIKYENPGIPTHGATQYRKSDALLFQESIDFNNGAIYFDSGKFFESKSVFGFNRLQKKCQSQNPNFTISRAWPISIWS